MARRLSAVVCMALFATGAAWSDVVHFKKGYFLEAKVVDKGDSWLLLPLETARIRIPRAKTVPKDDVARIVYEEDFRKQFDAKRAALKPGDKRGEAKLLKWCHAEHMTAIARSFAKELFDAQKKQAEAKSSAKAYYDAGRWAASSPQRYYLPREAAKNLYEAALAINPNYARAHVALKHKKVGGKWMTKEDYAAHKADAAGGADEALPSFVRKKKGKRKKKTPIWQIALYQEIDFKKINPDEVKKAFGPPSRVNSNTSENDGQTTKYDYIYYKEGPVQTKFDFRNGKLTEVEVSCSRRDVPDSDVYFLNGQQLSGK